MKSGLPGWDRLRHGGLLLDGTRHAALSRCVPGPLDEHTERHFPQRAGAILTGGGDGGATSSLTTAI